MKVLEITPHNNVFIQFKTTCNETMLKLREHFSYEIDRWKVKGWSGSGNPTICLLKYNKYLYKGLLPYFIDFLHDNNIPYKLDPSLNTKKHLSDDVFDKFIDGLKLPFEPRFYQKEAVKRVLESSMKTVISPTASGKSLIGYLLIMSYLMSRKDKKKKVLLIVPSISLVSQMMGDFINYAENNEKINIPKICQPIHGAVKDKEFSKEVLIITWQSLQNKKKEFFEQFGCVVFDEAHVAKSAVAIKILESLDNTDIRMGMTGTLPDDNILQEKTIEGLLGTVIHSISTRQMIDMGFSCDLKVMNVILKYNKHSAMDYPTERQFITEQPKRVNVLQNMTSQFKGNTLVLFRTISYGKQLAEEFRMIGNKKVFYIDGSVSGSERESIRSQIEKNDNCIIVASYGTTSTGVSIKNLHNVLFAEGMKSKIKVMQSIGRGLRQHSSKEFVYIIDVVDYIPYTHKWRQHSYSFYHFLKRKEYYKIEKFETVEKLINMNS